jgi:hypothetical protein
MARLGSDKTIAPQIMVSAVIGGDIVYRSGAPEGRESRKSKT